MICLGKILISNLSSKVCLHQTNYRKKKASKQDLPTFVNVDTHDKQGSHWLSIFVENDQFEIFDSYGLPIHWYKSSPFVTWVFKHYQDVSSNVGQLQATDSNTFGHYALFLLFATARGKSMESFVQPFKYLRDVDNDHKINETPRKLVTYN